jgi:hypothetical protein
MLRRVGAATELGRLGLLIGVLPIACVTTHLVHRPVTQDVLEQLKSDGMDRTVTVEYVTGARPQAPPDLGTRSPSALQAKTESAEGLLAGANLRQLELHLDGHNPRRVSFADVSSIKITNRNRGALHGTFVGLFGGALAGVIFGALASDWGCSNNYYGQSCPSTFHRELAFGLGGLVIGAGLGVLVGLAVGDRTIFAFRNRGRSCKLAVRPKMPTSRTRQVKCRGCGSPSFPLPPGRP